MMNVENELAKDFYRCQSNTKAGIHYSQPNEAFWRKYTNLWTHSYPQSAFQSPHYLQELCERYADNLAYFKCYCHNTLLAAAFFRKERGVYHFLSDVKADHNFFAVHNECTERDLKAIFKQFFLLVRQENWPMVLHNQPAWAAYMPIFCKQGKKYEQFFSVSDYSGCPVIDGASPQDLLAHVNRPKIRYKINRLEKQQHAVFEVFKGDEYLQEWIDGYCELHIKRWEDTNSISKYIDKTNITALMDWMHCWIEDKILTRFSIKIGNKRIAYVICLLEQDRLVHHTTAFDRNYYKYSPGIALILFIARWMEKEGLSKLDFGEGNESYKFEFADKTLPLQRIFISNYRNLSFIMKASIETSFRNNPRLQSIYRDNIKSLVSKVRRWCHHSNN